MIFRFERNFKERKCKRDCFSISSLQGFLSCVGKKFFNKFCVLFPKSEREYFYILTICGQFESLIKFAATNGI